MSLTGLPTDIVVLFFPYLNAKEFLAFTSCHPSLVQYRQDPVFWQNLTRSTFRIPAQPLLEDNGAHWQSIYKRLKTQTHVYTWGSNSRGNLGHRPAGHRQVRIRVTSGWPQEMVNVDRIGVVSDVQCGGWSTVLLSATGVLWAAGVLNGMMELLHNKQLLQLKFPPAWPAASLARYEASTAIQHFSLGRYRLLALSDDNKIWEWVDFKSPAVMINFFTIDSRANQANTNEGKVTKVVAGWNKSSAYILGTGIVYWSEVPPVGNELDTHIVEHHTVPGTAFRKKFPNRVAKGSVDANIGEVLDYTFLDGYIVFVTHSQKLFAWPTDGAGLSLRSPVELTQFYEGSMPCVKSVQGSFLNFGVFTNNGAVLIGNKTLLDSTWANHTDSLGSGLLNRLPKVIPALQNSGVVSLAFGDYHLHARHSNGSITSYGTESQACGSLGLGDTSISHLRGVYFAQRNTGDGELKIPTWSDGRRTVWFEEEKQQWLEDTCQKGATSEASPRVLRLAQDPATAEVIGEWFEREGRHWSKGPNGLGVDTATDNYSVLEPYYVLKVSAAGHSSAALVLVDEEKAAKVRKMYVVKEPDLSETNDGQPPRTSFQSYVRWILGWEDTDARENERRNAQRPDRDSEEARRARADEIRYNSTYVWDQQGFPRLRYPNGELMPGEISPTPWKGGEPDMSHPNNDS